ncbi:MAG: fused MFS/spermidine synthase [Gammaproteobacteria bacterium]
MQHRYHNFLIFITGACILALEIVASRVETPYFGVSLYIWSAILATTLFFLAAGYYAGGIISAKSKHDQLEIYFLAAPLLASLSILFACLLYPVLFPVLGRINLLLGSFAGAVMLLGIPLVCLSAMNPMLITLSRRQEQAGDAGAGRVFFVSTTGSVLGVFLTAFVLIPNMSNFNALVSISLLLILVVMVYLFRGRGISPLQRTRLLLVSIFFTFLCVSLLVFKNYYLNQLASLQRVPATSRVLAEYHTLFGNTKVITHFQEKTGRVRYLTLVKDGHVLNNTLPDGTSLDSYTYLLEALAYMFNSQPGQVLVLGLGAGIVPARMSGKGSDVTVVELDQGVINAATDHFNFNKSGINLVREDARTFVRRCPRHYDIVIVDLFQGDGIPDYLMTEEFFSDIKACMTRAGTLVMNSFYDTGNRDLNMYIPATLARSFPVIYQALWADADHPGRRYPVVNRYLVGRNANGGTLVAPVLENMPPSVKSEYAGTLAMLQRVPGEQLASIPAITDEKNFYNVTFAKMHMAYRYLVLQTQLPHLLLN